MDITYLIVAAAFWLAIFGLAQGCERLQQPKVKP